MKLLQAIKLLAPYHNAQLTCINPDSHPFPTAQLSTGLADCPFISVNDGSVRADDVYDVLILHAEIARPTRPASSYSAYQLN